MKSLVVECSVSSSPEALAESLSHLPGVVLLRSGLYHSVHARYSLVTARPFLTFRSFGSRCEIWQDHSANASRTQYGSPWSILDGLLSMFELQDQVDLPFPLGGCFGYWGYDLKCFLEPGLPRRSANDLELPDCHLGFYDSLVVFDHALGKTWIVATGLGPDGSRSESRASQTVAIWREHLEVSASRFSENVKHPTERFLAEKVSSSMSQEEFIEAVRTAQKLIRAGDIYQVNLSHRLHARVSLDAWSIFAKLATVSPSPYAGYIDCGEFQLLSSSPESFLKLSGSHIQTRPIKGTRPRSAEPSRDSQLTYELQTSSKEIAELVMITDLLRNDLGKVCEFGSVHVPEILRLEKYSHVQHLVSTVEGRLRKGISHLAALAACFPGGSITGAPKYRAMEVIDELEPTSRGPYTGALGYFGFNRESQLGMVIRSAICRSNDCWFQVGAGIVADSNPGAEYEETIAKARGFLAALNIEMDGESVPKEVVIKEEFGSAFRP